MMYTDWFPTGHHMSLYLQADAVQQTEHLVNQRVPASALWDTTLCSRRRILQMKFRCCRN